MADIFRNKFIFITGSTGFLGKVLLEKLLRSCPGIEGIFLLFRPSANISSRLSALCESSVFDRIKSECPEVLKKLLALPGDITEENLGLSEEDFGKILSTVSYVFHCAASVRFEDDPRKTLEINLVGVKNIVDMCHKMEKLQVLVHVSTAYSFCNQPIITEEIFDEEVDPAKIINNLKFMDAKHLRSLAKGRPSVYHYSKAVAEKYIAEHGKNLPYIIVRPAIITAAWKEPFPGWIDNYNGPSGFIALSSKGILKTLLVKKDIPAEWVPVDLVANTLIVSAHAITEKRFEFSVVNCVCPVSNQISWSEVVNMTIPLLYKYPSQHLCMPPGGIVTSSVTVNKLCQLALHYLPAFLIDCILLPLYGKIRLVRMYRRIHGVLSHLQLYTTHRFNFSSTNMTELATCMSLTDRNIFPIDQKCMDWCKYMNNYVLGVRKFFLKESDSTIPSARQKLRWVQLLWFCVKTFPIGLLVLYISRRHYFVHSNLTKLSLQFRS